MLFQFIVLRGEKYRSFFDIKYLLFFFFFNQKKKCKIISTDIRRLRGRSSTSSEFTSDNGQQTLFRR